MNIKILFLIWFFKIYEYECGVAVFGGRGSNRVSNRTTNFVPFGPSAESNYYTAYNVHKASYGTSFGRNGLDSNTHIYGDNYKVYDSKTYKFLVEYLFNRDKSVPWKTESKLRDWSETDDRRWHFTTKAPFFMNKIPRSENVLSAAAVIGAASAVGLKSLLPLNVPEGSPLIYCPDLDLRQSKMKLDGKLYSCVENFISVICLDEVRSFDGTFLNDANETKTECFEENLQCLTSAGFNDVNLSCESGKLKSSSSIFCDSLTTVNNDENILSCFYGELHLNLASFIPTTESSIPATTEKQEETSFFGSVKGFFSSSWKKLNFFQSSEPNEVTDEDVTEKFAFQNNTSWLPEALPITL